MRGDGASPISEQEQADGSNNVRAGAAMTARKPLPATYWADKQVWANRCLAQSRSFLLAVTDAVTDPADPWAIELRNARRDAAKADVEAWKAYIRRAEEAFADAADHEMAEADEKERAAAHYAEQARLAEQQARRHRYDGDAA